MKSSLIVQPLMLVSDKKGSSMFLSFSSTAFGYFEQMLDMTHAIKTNTSGRCPEGLFKPVKIMDADENAIPLTEEELKRIKVHRKKFTLLSIFYSLFFVNI